VLTDKTWWLSMADRLVKTFVGGYLTFWLLTAGLGDTTASTNPSSAFDTLFTWNNVKAGVVAVALSFAQNVLTTKFGVDHTAPSLTVREAAPPETLPPAH